MTPKECKRSAKAARLKTEKDLGTSAGIRKYEIDEAGGNEKLDEQIAKLEARVKGISSASEEATQRLTIITAVMKNLIDTKRGQGHATNHGKKDIE